MNQYRFCLFLLAASLSFDVALADLTVSNTNSQGPGSRDDVVRAANNISSLKTIRFSLPGSGPMDDCDFEDINHDCSRSNRWYVTIGV
jgi:hypothetical protein